MRWIAYFITLCIVAGLVGCADPAETDPPEGTPPATTGGEVALPAEDDPPLFELNRLPDLEPFEQISDITAYYGEGPWDRLSPSEDYGTLYPYLGKVLGTEIEWATQELYGLCTEKGEIVVSPAYTYVRREYINEEKTEWVLMLYHQPEDESQMEASRVTIAAKDGSWVIEAGTGWAQVSEGRVVVTSGSGWNEENWTWGKTESAVYNAADGQLICGGISGNVSAYSDGISVIYDDAAGQVRYMDLDGNILFTGSSGNGYASSFFGGRAVAYDDETGLYGLIDTSGAWVLAPTYGELWNYGDYCFARSKPGDHLQYVIDKNGAVVLAAQEVSLYDYSIAYVREGEKREYYHLDTGEMIFSIENDNAYVMMHDGHWFSIRYEENGGGIRLYRDGELVRDLAGVDYVQTLGYGDEMTHLVAVTADENYANPKSELLDRETGETIVSYPESYHINNILEDGRVLLWREGVWNEESGKIVTKAGYFLGDLGGNVVSTTRYESFSEAGEGRYAVRTNRYGGLIDSEENWIVRVSINTLD